MQPDKSKPKYISSNRARTAGVRDFSGQNSSSFFAQAVSSAAASPVDETYQKRKRILMTVSIAAGSILLILAMVVLVMRRFSNTGAGDIDIEKFNARIEYHDAMKCTLYEGSKAKDSDYMVLANDGWSEVYLRNIWLADNVTDVFYVNDRIYSVVYNGAKTDRNVVKEKSFIETKEQFAKRTGLNFPDGLKLAEDDKRKIRCNAQGNDIEYHRPNVSRMTNVSGGSF